MMMKGTQSVSHGARADERAVSEPTALSWEINQEQRELLQPCACDRNHKYALVTALF